MSRFATRITVSSAWAGMLQSRLAARAANASLMARSLGDWWDHHAAGNMQTVTIRASPFGLRGIAESRQQRAETRHDARRLMYHLVFGLNSHRSRIRQVGQPGFRATQT